MVHRFFEVVLHCQLVQKELEKDYTWGSDMSVQVLVFFFTGFISFYKFLHFFESWFPHVCATGQGLHQCQPREVLLSCFCCVVLCFKESFSDLAPHLPPQQSSALIDLSLCLAILFGSFG